MSGCCQPQWVNPCCQPPQPPPQACPPWWWWMGGGSTTKPTPLNVTFAINWGTPSNIALNAVIPAGTWVYVGPASGAVNVATAHGTGSVTTAAFIYSDGTMTATVAGILYPVTAT